MTTMVAVASAWLLTYLVHSTLLLGGVAVLARWVVRREALRESLWKAALVGGVVTATLALAAPRPGLVRIAVSALDAPAERAATGSAIPAERSALAESPSRVDRRADDAGGVPSYDRVSGVGSGAIGEDGQAALVTAPATDGSGESGIASGFARSAMPAILFGFWAMIAAGLLVRLGYRHARLRWLLRDRRQVPGSDPAAVALTELRRTAGVWKPVRLTSTAAVATPLALGRAEVCVPERFLSELDLEEQRAALAHELAHLARRDPIWQLAGSLASAIFFFQPLNELARRRIRAAAEYLADGWAVRHTGSQVELARCLASVAGWVAPSQEPMLAGTVAMAEGGSPLMSRVKRLLEHEPEAPTRPALRVAVAAGLVAVAAGFAPAVSPTTAATSPTSDLGASAWDASGSDDPADGGAGWDADIDADTDSDTEADSEVDGERQIQLEADESPDPVQEQLVVHRLDRPGVEGDGFVARLNEAGRDARQSPYWVAYAVPAVPEAGKRLIVDSDSWSTRSLGGMPMAERLGVSAELDGRANHLLVLVSLVPDGAATRVDRISMRRADLGMSIAGDVYWLGVFDAEPSFRWLRDIHLAGWSGSIREAAVDAISAHPVDGAADYLLQVVERDRESNVRENALEGLLLQLDDTALGTLYFDHAMNDPQGGLRRESTELLAHLDERVAVPLLERLAMEAPDGDVRRQAAESLGDVGTARAADVLRRLVNEHPDEDVRREALESLGDQSSGVEAFQDGEVLMKLALTADDEDLRRDAVEQMEKLDPAVAVRLLDRVAFQSGDETTERQAAESLGKLRTDAAFDALVKILRENPGETAAFQAVESLAENFPARRVLPILQEALTNHPSSRVRREALDVMGDLTGG